MSDRGSSTVVLVRDPLFAVITGGRRLRDGDDAVDVAFRLLEVNAPRLGAAVGCAALLNLRSVTATATAGAVFRARDQDVECLVDGSAAPSTRSLSTRPGDLYALCSPGLLAAVSVARIGAVLRSHGPPPQAAKRLFAFANQSHDARDAAIVVFRVSAGR